MTFVALTFLKFSPKQYKRKSDLTITLSFYASFSKKQALYNDYYSKIHLLLARQKRQIEMLEYMYGISEGEIVGGFDNDEYFCEFYDRYLLYLHNDDIQDDFIKDFCSFQTSTHLDSIDLRDKYLMSLNTLNVKTLKPLGVYKKHFPFKF